MFIESARETTKRNMQQSLNPLLTCDREF